MLNTLSPGSTIDIQTSLKPLIFLFLLGKTHLSQFLDIRACKSGGVDGGGLIK
jgi:hypothetical protein